MANLNYEISYHLVTAYIFNAIAHHTFVLDGNPYAVKAHHWTCAKTLIDKNKLGDWTYSQTPNIIYFYNRRLNVQLSFHYGNRTKKPQGYQNPQWVCRPGYYACQKLIRHYGLIYKEKIIVSPDFSGEAYIKTQGVEMDVETISTPWIKGWLTASLNNKKIEGLIKKSSKKYKKITAAPAEEVVAEAVKEAKVDTAKDEALNKALAEAIAKKNKNIK